MAIIGVGGKGADWYILRGTAEDDIMTSSGEYYAGQEDRGLVFYGNGGNDTISNSQPKSQIYGGTGDDSIDNWADEVLIKGGDILPNLPAVGTGNDQIINHGKDVTIDAGDGNDTIANLGGVASTIMGGAGNDVIQEGGVLSTIYGGEGNDSVDNSWNGGTVYVYTSGNDTISGFVKTNTLVIDSEYSVTEEDDNLIINVPNRGVITVTGVRLNVIKIVSSLDEIQSFNLINNSESYIKVIGTSAKDYIRNQGAGATLDGGDGDDYIVQDIFSFTEDSSASINGGIGNDYIKTFGSFVTVDGGDGDDLIEVLDQYGDESDPRRYTDAVIKGGAGSDTIDNRVANATISGGAGNDKITNNGDNVTIDSGDGDDSIGNWNENAYNISINVGAGNDSVENNSSNVTISGGAGEDSIHNYGGSNVSISGGKGEDIIRNYDGLSAVIDGGDDNDRIYNESSYTSINGGKGDDFLQIGDYDISGVTAHGGEGDDTFYNNGKNAVISGGDGADYIQNDPDAENVSVDGGAGDDFFVEYGKNTTITGGTGNDTIAISVYAKNLTITDLTPADVLDFQEKPKFARFEDGVLDMGNIKIALPNVTDIEVYRDMTVTWDRSTYMKLGTFLDAPAYVWTVEQVGNTTTARYGMEGGDDAEIVLTGLKKGLTSSQVAKGINISSMQVELTAAVLGDSDVVFEQGYDLRELALTDDVRPNHSDKWTYDKAAGTYKYKSTILTDGYKISDGGKKISLLKTGEVYDRTVVKGLKKNLTINADGSIDGIYVENVSDTFGRVFFDDMSLLEDNVTVEGEGRDLIFRDHGDYTGKTLYGTEADNSMYIEGSNALIRSKGGNDFIGIYHSDNTVDTGTGDDTVLAYYDNLSVQTGAGNDEVEVSGTNNIISAGEGNDYIYNNGALDYSYNTAMMNAFATLRDAAKAELENVLEQFNTDPDLKSIIEQGANSPVFDDMDAEDAQTLADFFKATKEFVEDSLAYETDSETAKRLAAQSLEESAASPLSAEEAPQKNQQNGDNFAKNANKALIFAGKINAVAGIPLAGTGAEIPFRQINYSSSGRTTSFSYTEGKVNALSEMGLIKEGSKASKWLKWGGKTNAVFSVGIPLLQLGLKYAAYKEAEKRYDERRQCIISNWTSENFKEIDNCLKEIDKELEEKFKDVVDGWVDLGFGILGLGLGIAAAAGVGALATAATPALAVMATSMAVSALITTGTNFVASKVKESYRNADHSDTSNVQLSVKAEIAPADINPNEEDADSLFNTPTTPLLAEEESSAAVVTLNGEGGEDAFENDGQFVLINAGDDDDAVVNRGALVTINAGAGNDYMENTGDNVSISGGTGDDSIANGGNNVTVDGGAGDNYLASEGDNVTLKVLDGDNTINTYASENVSVVAGKGDDSIVNALGSNITINAGDGDNVIENYGGTNMTITGGAGVDIVENYGDTVKIDSGTNDDIIFNYGKKVSINTGAGDDLIIETGSANTIDGGTGDDVIDLQDSTNALVKYTAGDGNDSITNINSTATLQIGGGTGTYSSAKSGDNLILTVGTGSITLIDAATQKLNILGKENSALNWKLNGTTATYGNSITVTGVKSLDGVSLNNKTVTISNAALNQGTVTISDGYTLALGSDVAKSSTTAAKWTSSGSTYTYTAAGTSAGYKLSGNKISYTSASGGDKFTISGVKNTSAVTVSGKKVTVGSASLNGKAVTLTGDFTLALGKDVATSAKKTAGAFSTVSKGTATYKTAATSDYYKISGKKISYTSATGGQNITIKNLNTAATLSTVKNGVTVAEKSGTYNITFKNSAVLTTKAPTISVAKGLKYTVAVADSLKPVTKSAWTVSGTTATFRTNTTAGYSVNSKNAVVYSAQKTGSPLLEINGLAKGVKASSIAAPKNKVVTLNANVLGANSSVKSNGGGYTLNLTGNMSGKKFVGSAKVDTLTVAANNANVDLGAGNDVVTVSGLKVTLSGGAGNDTLTGGKNVDLLYGGAGNDLIYGNAGNDKLFGQDGNDILRGGTGNDTLSGGKGNDSLWGDTGKDTFLYSSGDGKDIIYGFDGGDLLQITGTFSASYNKSKKEIYFKVGSTANAITLRDFTATSFHINGDTYGISNNKFIKK